MSTKDQLQIAAWTFLLSCWLLQLANIKVKAKIPEYTSSISATAFALFAISIFCFIARWLV